MAALLELRKGFSFLGQIQESTASQVHSRSCVTPRIPEFHILVIYPGTGNVFRFIRHGSQPV